MKRKDRKRGGKRSFKRRKQGRREGEKERRDKPREVLVWVSAVLVLTRLPTVRRALVFRPCHSNPGRGAASPALLPLVATVFPCSAPYSLSPTQHRTRLFSYLPQLLIESSTTGIKARMMPSGVEKRK